MLVFWRGQWHEVALPEYMDPSWSIADQQRLALAILRGAGRPVEEILTAVEAVIFNREGKA